MFSPFLMQTKGDQKFATFFVCFNLYFSVLSLCLPSSQPKRKLKLWPLLTENHTYLSLFKSGYKKIANAFKTQNIEAKYSL